MDKHPHQTEQLLKELALQKQTIEQLRKNELYYQIYFENVSDVFFTMDSDTVITDISPSIEKVLGYKPNELIGNKFLDLKILAATEVDKAVSNTLRAFGGEKVSAVYQFVARDGSIKWGEVVTTPLTRKGKVAALVSVARDITERKRAEEAIRQSEARLRTITDSSQDAIVMMDHKGEVSFWNPAAEKMFGYTAKEAIGKNLHLLLAPERYHADHQKAFAHFQQTGDGNAVGKTIELMARHRAGRQFPVELSLSAIKIDHKWHSVAIVRDISQRRLAEAEHEELLKKLSQAQKMESIGRLAGGVAHDFNNMLGVIIGHAELVLDSLDKNSPFYSRIVEILKAANHSKEITRQLLAFARSQNVSPKVLDINEVIGKMLKMLHRLIGENICLEWIPGPKIWPVYIDTSQVSQILTNLLVNARDSIKDRGKITIKTVNVTLDEAFCCKNVGFSPGQYVRLSVSDNGSGMDSETLERIFEPFFTTKGTGRGTGLGLATVYGIVKQNKGIIDVNSKLGKGTRITIYLRRHEGRPERQEPDSRRQVADGQGTTILLVEDEQMIMEVGASILNQLGYHVLTAPTPARALDLARKHSHKLDLLITDVIMPEMNGRELAQRIQLLCPGLKVLFMSGYTADVIAHQGVIDENVNFIQKPFSIDELAQAVRRALEI